MFDKILYFILLLFCIVVTYIFAILTLTVDLNGTSHFTTPFGNMKNYFYLIFCCIGVYGIVYSFRKLSK